MPPFVPRKHRRSPSPASSPSKRLTRTAPPRRAKETVFKTLDSAPRSTRSLEQTKALLEEEDDESELSDIGSDEFEDVAINGAGLSARGRGKRQEAAGGQVDDDSEEDEEWEDALGSHHHAHKHPDDHLPTPIPSGDLELILSSSAHPMTFSATKGGKKGPSKIERQIRTVTHRMHVQFLMFHNLVRNAWIQDKEVQRILVKGLSKGCWKEVESWWRNTGIMDGHAAVVDGGYARKEVEVERASAKGKGKGKQAAGKPTPKNSRAQIHDNLSEEKDINYRSQRNWGASSTHLESKTPNLSAGDPLLRLLKYLSAFWKQKFRPTAPCLRKRGYLPSWALEAEIEAWRRDMSNAGNFGERVESLEAFRELARKCEGSRDVGQQLFTALLRGLGIEARMVASLQPVGFGWSQAEEGKVRKGSGIPEGKAKQEIHEENGKCQNGINLRSPNKANPESSLNTEQSKRKALDGGKSSPIDLDDVETSDLSSSPPDSDSSLKVGFTAKRKFKVTSPNPSRKYGQELPYPTYWTEAFSPTTRTPIAVSLLPLSVVAPASNPDLLVQFYPRGAAAEKAKQVFGYLIAFSSDGTAKDVTTRYLPRGLWPGKTKGVRIPIEKIPVHDGRGKVRKWEKWDWFKNVMRPYTRSAENRTLWDEVEDEGDLVPAKPAKAKAMDEEGGKETLQGYKSSAEFVLERHLRREEALLLGAEVVRYFKTGKGEKETKEPIYLRKDVVTCKTIESWHKEGRQVKEGEQPLKFVPMRAVTVTRKREIEEREREEGEKVKQGLYSEAQTDWIIPDPIQDGRIPRNAFGNIDVYVPTMVPKGAVHIPLRGTARVCKRLEVDFAEACTGFEFGKQRAVPVLTGVVVAKENEDLVIDAWEAEEAERKCKEESKKEKLILGLWKKFLLGLRVVERMNREYGEEDGKMPEDVNPSAKKVIMDNGGEEAAHGERDGFLPQEHEDLEGGFIRDGEGDNPEYVGGFIAEHEDDLNLQPGRTAPQSHPHTPISFLLPHNQTITRDESPGADAKEYQSDRSSVEAPQKVNQRVGHGRGRRRGRGSRGARSGRGGIASRTPQSDQSSKIIPKKQHRMSDEDAESTPEVNNGEDFGEPVERKDLASRASKQKPKRKAARKSETAARSHYFPPNSGDKGNVMRKERRPKAGDILGYARQ